MDGARSTDELGHLLGIVAAYATDYLTRTAHDPVAIRATTAQLREWFGGELPAAGADPAQLLHSFIAAAEPGISPSTSGRFFGFVTGGAYPVAVATEWLTTAWDQTPVLHTSSPTASVVEETVAGWLVGLFGLPAATSVGITSGCSTANLTGLAAARHQVLADAGWDVGHQGLFGAPTPRVLTSRGCHVTVSRALRLLGLGGQIHLVDTDDQGRMRLDHLADLLAATTGPLIVCAQLGNVDTGAVDALAEICAMTHAHGGWVHVDAAFGMWAAASSRLRAELPALAGLARADSWATDAHKWLNVPYDCGVVLCAHPEAHQAAMRARADYLPAGPAGSRDPVDYTPEMSRRARALVLWTTLRHLGADGVAELIERSCLLARRMAGRLATVDGVTVANEVSLNQVLVRFTTRPGAATGGTGIVTDPAADPAAEAADDAHTEAVVDAFQRGGVGWASPTRWQGRTMLRLSVCNWQTDTAAVDAAVSALVDAHLRLRSRHQPDAARTLARPPSQPGSPDQDLVTEGTA
ncbi:MULTISPECIES: pyridoxal phosphate-dependent decarboxylase family protein [Pseudofrankia]|uniref:pyridoxal phosphate-dependent decarboxylase family protein n=1 Tax=Pseudofrankia TaxID=2994363 RepID=UPI000234CB17|nr:MULTISPECIES: aminotransferase class V-fold PLP-dependent enzyme [Pseudofrankia]OHV35376.1 pyridoxal-dependent decarboxylase [Pseudofrankia sp. EUN1h]